MAADAARFARVSSVLRASLAGFAVFVGILSVLQDSLLDPLPHRGSLHALFGVLLWVCIVERFYARSRVGVRMSPADIRQLARHLAGRVYLLLYLLIALRLIIDLFTAPQHALHAAADFRSYLVCGVVAIVTIKALAALCQHLVMHGADAPRNLVPRETLVQRNGRLT